MGGIGYNPEIKEHGPTESHLQTMLEHLLKFTNSSDLEGDSEGKQIFIPIYTLILMCSFIPDIELQTLSGGISISEATPSTGTDHHSLPKLNIESADMAEVQPAQSSAKVSEGWADEERHLGGGNLSAADSKKEVKQMIEKHTIEVINLENKLKIEETNHIKEVLADYEDRKAKAIEYEREVLSKLLTVTDEHNKIDAVAKSAQHLENVLATIEEEKTEAVNNVIKKLVEEQFTAKSALMR